MAPNNAVYAWLVPNDIKCYVALKSVALQHGFTSANTFSNRPKWSALSPLWTHRSCHISSLSLPLSPPAASISTSSLPPSVFMLSTVRPRAGTSLSAKPDLDMGRMAGEAFSLVQIIPLFSQPLQQNNTLLSHWTTIQALTRQPLFMTLIFPPLWCRCNNEPSEKTQEEATERILHYAEWSIFATITW